MKQQLKQREHFKLIPYTRQNYKQFIVAIVRKVIIIKKFFVARCTTRNLIAALQVINDKQLF